MIRDLNRIEEHRKYLASLRESKERPEGALHFRNCFEGCPSMDWFQSTKQLVKGGDRDVLRMACEQCDLAAAPYHGAKSCIALSLLPPEQMPQDLPWSIVQGIAYLHARRRVF